MKKFFFIKDVLLRLVFASLLLVNMTACGKGNVMPDDIKPKDVDSKTKTVTTVAELRSYLYSAKPGDTLLISGTINVGNGAIHTSKHGTLQDYIVIKGINNGMLLFTNNADEACLKIMHNYYKVVDLVVDANSKSKRGILIEGASHGIVLNVEVRNTLQEGVKIRKNSQYWYFERCGVVESGKIGKYGEGFYCGDAFANWTTGDSPDLTGYITFNKCYTKRTHADGFDFKEGTHHIKVINCTVDFENIELDMVYGNSGVFSRANYLQVIDCVFKNNSKGDRSCVFIQNKLAKDGVYYGSNSEIKNITVDNFKNYLYWTDQSGFKLYNDYTITNCPGLIQPGSPATAIIADPVGFIQMTWDGVGGNSY
jgi:hypothetical protein